MAEKNFCTSDYVRDPYSTANLAQIHLGGLLGKWVKYNHYLFMLFLETRLQVRPIDGFSR